MQSDGRDIEWGDVFKYYLVYSVSFLFVAWLCFRVFIVNKRSLLWSLDGLPVLLPSFMHQNQLPVESLYDYMLGLGSDGYGFFSSWYFEPFQFVTLLFVDNPGIIEYSIISILKMYLAGVTFSAYCISEKCSYFSSCIAALVYVFSIYTLYIGIRFPAFLVVMVYMPLLLIGFDKIIKSNRISFLFIIMVALSAISHIYFLYINVIFSVIYFGAYCFSEKLDLQGILQRLAKCFLCGVLGIGISAFVFIPNVINLSKCNRAKDVICTPSLFYYGEKWINYIIAYLISPMTSENQPNYEFYIGVIPLAIVCLFIFFIIDTEKKYWKIVIVILFVFMLSPVFAYIFCGFTNVSNRWTYLWVFVSSLCTAYSLDLDFDKCKKKVMLISGFYIVLDVFLIFDIGNIVNIYTLLGATIFLFFLMLLNAKNLFADYGILWKGILVIFVVGGIFLYSIVMFSPLYGNYIEEFALNDDVVSDMHRFENCFEKSSVPYRVEFKDNSRSNLGFSYINAYASTGFYSNTIPELVSDFYKGVECSGYEENIINYDLDSRVGLMELLSVKYYVADRFKPYNVPYGFSYVKTKDARYDIYVNNYYIPPVFFYDSYMDESDWKKLNALEKEQVLLSSAVISENNQVTIKKIKNYGEVKSIRTNQEFGLSGVQILDKNKYYSEYPLAEMNILVEDNNMGGDYYLQLQDFRIEDDVIAHWNIKVLAFYEDGFVYENAFAVLSDKNNYNPQIDDYTVNIGNRDSKLEKVVLQLPYNGTYSCRGVKVSALSDCGAAIRTFLRLSEKVTNINFMNNMISFVSNSKEAGVVCVGIPYNSGWTAYVDGVKTNTIPVNIGFLGLNLSQGKHDVELVYTVPGLVLGKIVTVISLLSMAALALYINKPELFMIT